MQELKRSILLFKCFRPPKPKWSIENIAHLKSIKNPPIQLNESNRIVFSDEDETKIKSLLERLSSFQKRSYDMHDFKVLFCFICFLVFKTICYWN